MRANTHQCSLEPYVNKEVLAQVAKHFFIVFVE